MKCQMFQSVYPVEEVAAYLLWFGVRALLLLFRLHLQLITNDGNVLEIQKWQNAEGVENKTIHPVAEIAQF